jgi:hypothetical protein
VRKLRIRDLSLIWFLIPFTILSLGSSLFFFNPVFGQSESFSDNTSDCYNSDLTSEDESGIIATASAYDFPDSGPFISISTDLVRYIAGDIVWIYGYVLDSNGCPVQQPVHLQIDRGSEEVHRSTVVSDSYDGYFEDVGLNADKAGVYKVKVIVNGTDPNNYPKTQFEVKEIFDTRPAYMLYVGVGFFGGLAFILLREIKNVALTEMLRFICLTGIAFSIIAALLLTDVQIGANSPVGLVQAVKRADGDGNCDGSDLSSDLSSGPKREWMINFGGQPPDYCGTGIQVPVNIIVFGIAGGYLRYLWDTARLREKMQEIMKKNSQNVITRTWLFYVSLHDLALFILSPLLAIVVWFVLSESGATGLFTIAAISFTVGLVTEEIIQTLMRFTTSILRSAESVSGRTQDKTVEIKEISNGNGKKEAIEKKGEEAIVQRKDTEETKSTNTATTA